MLRQYLQLPRTVHVLCAGTVINRAGTMLLPFLTLYLTERQGLSVHFATTAIGAFGLGGIAANLTGGWLADHVGRRPVMLVSLTGGAGMIMLFGSLTSGAAILTTVLIFAFIAEMYRPAASAMIADLVEPQHRPHAFGLMYLAVNLGFSIAPVAGGLLARYSFQWLFLADAVTCLLYAGIVWLWVPETRPTLVLHGDSEPSDLANESAEQRVRSSALGSILGNRAFLVYCLGSLGVAIVYLQSFSTLPLYMKGRFGLGPEVYGRVIAVNGLMIVCLQILMTSWVTRFDRGAVMTISAAVTALGFGCTALAETPWQFAAAVIVWTCGEMMQAPLWNTVVTDLAPVAYRARYLGFFSMTFSTGHVLGAPLGGWVLDRWGGIAVWVGAAAIALAAAALFRTVGRHLGSTAGPIGLDQVCKKCGYSLRDLVEPRCPECGERFDWR